MIGSLFHGGAGLLAGAILLTCGTAGTTPLARIDVPFTLRAGETMVVEDALRVELVEIRNDSRCPVDVTCVWQGDVELVLRVAGRQEVLQRSKGPLTAGAYEVVLRELRPERRGNQSIAQSEYVAELLVRRRS